MIVSDDQATWATGFGGNAEILTPALDRLASSGTVYSNAFCTSPVCSPSRSSILTGLMPTQTGVLDWLADSPRQRLNYINPPLSLATILDSAGWRTSLSGKWHLGNTLEPQAGYRHWYAHADDGGAYHGASMVRDGRVECIDYVSTAIADESIRFITECARADAPFFASVHFTAPHAPWAGEHPLELSSLYEDCPFRSCPQETRHQWFEGFRDIGGRPAAVHPLMMEAFDDPRPHLIGMFSAVTGMDREVSRIIATLDDEHIRDTTLVIFTSDNGFNAGHHGIWGKGNGTFPLNLYDTSVKVPLVLNQPGRIAPGVTDHRLVSGYDLRPTVLSALKIEDRMYVGPGSPFERDAPIETSAAAEHVFVCDEYGSARMVRTSDWKLVHRNGVGPDELYDVRNDPFELEDRIDDRACRSLRRDLEQTLQQWFDRLAPPRYDADAPDVSGRGQIALLTGRRNGSPFRRHDEPIPT